MTRCYSWLVLLTPTDPGLLACSFTRVWSLCGDRSSQSLESVNPTALLVM
jgi:hypothetical protein